MVVLAASVGCFLLMASPISPVSAEIVGGWTWTRDQAPYIAYLAGLYIASNLAIMLPTVVLMRRSQIAWVVIACVLCGLAWGALFSELLEFLPHPFDNGSGDSPHGFIEFVQYGILYASMGITEVMCSCHIVWPITFGELWLLKRISFGATISDVNRQPGSAFSASPR
jgi:hypothetical protein